MIDVYVVMGKRGPNSTEKHELWIVAIVTNIGEANKIRDYYAVRHQQNVYEVQVHPCYDLASELLNW